MLVYLWPNPGSNKQDYQLPFYHRHLCILEGNTMHRVHCVVSLEMASMGGRRTHMFATMGLDVFFPQWH
jgi:hypothetical protein